MDVCIASIFAVKQESQLFLEVISVALGKRCDVRRNDQLD